MCHAGGKGGRGRAEILRPQKLFLQNGSYRLLVSNAYTERYRDKGTPDNIGDKCDGQRIKRKILG